MDSGFSALELLVAMTILVVITTVALAVFASAQKGFGVLWSDTLANMAARRCLGAICRDLRASAPDHIALDASDPNCDAVRIQVPVGYANGVVEWGADGKPGQFVLYTVSNGALHRYIVDATNAGVGLPAVLATGVDVTRNGRKGFAFRRDGNLCTLELRMRVDRNGPVRYRLALTGVVARNL